jgi:hypothetical protein
MAKETQMIVMITVSKHDPLPISRSTDFVERPVLCCVIFWRVPADMLEGVRETNLGTDGDVTAKVILRYQNKIEQSRW